MLLILVSSEVRFDDCSFVSCPSFFCLVVFGANRDDRLGRGSLSLLDFILANKEDRLEGGSSFLCSAFGNEERGLEVCVSPLSLDFVNKDERLDCSMSPLSLFFFNHSHITKSLIRR